MITFQLFSVAGLDAGRLAGRQQTHNERLHAA